MQDNNLIDLLIKSNRYLLSLTYTISEKDAEKNEEKIKEEAKKVGIEYDNNSDTQIQGKSLAKLDQKIRIEKADIKCVMQNIIITYQPGISTDKILVELVFDYDGEGVLKKVYTRAADRKGMRQSLPFEEEEGQRLEDLLQVKERVKKILKNQIPRQKGLCLKA